MGSKTARRKTLFIPGGFGGYLLIMIVGMLISGAAALWVRSSYSKYSKQRSASGLTGAQTARMILDRSSLTNVRVEPVPGQLTDHYGPRSKVVRLSENNSKQRSIAAVSVAAREVGHAIQDFDVACRDLVQKDVWYRPAKTVKTGSMCPASGCGARAREGDTDHDEPTQGPRVLRPVERDEPPVRPDVRWRHPADGGRAEDTGRRVVPGDRCDPGGRGSGCQGGAPRS